WTACQGVASAGSASRETVHFPSGQKRYASIAARSHADNAATHRFSRLMRPLQHASTGAAAATAAARIRRRIRNALVPARGDAAIGGVVPYLGFSKVGRRSVDVVRSVEREGRIVVPPRGATPAWRLIAGIDVVARVSAPSVRAHAAGG